MASALKLTAKKRALTGRKVARLRRQQILPANIYGRDVKSLALELPLKEFSAVFKQAGETGIIQLAVDKEAQSRPVLVANVQQDPVSDGFLHVDFRQVDLTKKLIVAVPVEFIGEPPAVSQGGVLVKLINEVEVEALPGDLPDKVEVDISGLSEIGQSLNYQAIKVDAAKVKLMIEKQEDLIVKIEAPSKEEEAAPAPETPAEGETPAEAEGEEAKTKAKAEAPAEKPAGGDQGKAPAAKTEPR